MQVIAFVCRVHVTGYAIARLACMHRQIPHAMHSDMPPPTLPGPLRLSTDCNKFTLSLQPSFFKNKLLHWVLGNSAL